MKTWKLPALAAICATVALSEPVNSAPIVGVREFETTINPWFDYHFLEPNYFDLEHEKIVNLKLWVTAEASGELAFAFVWSDAPFAVSAGPALRLALDPTQTLFYDLSYTIPHCPAEAGIEVYNRSDGRVHLKGVFTHECDLPPVVPPVPEVLGSGTALLVLLGMVGLGKAVRQGS